MRAQKTRSSKRALRAVISRIRELEAHGDFEPGQRDEAIKQVMSLWRANSARDRRRAVASLVRVFLDVTVIETSQPQMKSK